MTTRTGYMTWAATEQRRVHSRIRSRPRHSLYDLFFLGAALVCLFLMS